MTRYTQYDLRRPEAYQVGHDVIANLPREIYLVRQALGLTQRQAADEIGIHMKRLGQIETGVRPSVRTVTMLKILTWLADASRRAQGQRPIR